MGLNDDSLIRTIAHSPVENAKQACLYAIQEHAKSKGMSVNQLVISLLEKDMGIDIVTIREQNKQNKENMGE